MRKFVLLLFFLFIAGINCHIKVVADLIKSEDFKLKGTFTINCAGVKNKYISIKEKSVLYSKNKQNFDIIESHNNSYYIISRYHQRFLGINQNNNKQIILYKNLDNTNSKYISWDLIKQNSNLTRSGYVYKIKNHFSNQYIYYDPNDNYTKLESFSNDIPITYFQFRILKLFSEEENIKQSNYDIVEKEPIDVFIKYIDLTDKNLTREGIKQIVKDFDSEELRYSLRSILQYIPWVRKIFILMPNDKVRFLKPYDEIKDKIVYVKDKDLLGYDTANIFAFSFNLHKMEKFNISKNFIYMEDDYFIGKKLKKTDFFYFDEKEKKVLPFVVNNYFREMNYNSRIGTYYYLYKRRNNLKVHGNRGWVLSVLGTDKYFADKYDMNVILPEFTHCAIPVNIDDLKDIYDAIQEYKYINETLHSSVRHVLTLNQPEFHNLYQLNVNHRRVNKIRALYINMEHSKMSYLYYPLFVLNTCGDNIPTKAEYQHHKAIMKKRYPNATKYEIGEEINDTMNNNSEELKDKINEIIKEAENNNNENENDNDNEIEKIKIQNLENNKKIKLDFEKSKYYIHGYILLGLLLSVVIFTKYKNIYEFDYD